MMRGTVGAIRARLVRALNLHGLVNPHFTRRSRSRSRGGHAETTRGGLDVIRKRRTVALLWHVVAGHEIVERAIMPFSCVENPFSIGDTQQVASHAGHHLSGLNRS